MCVHSHVNTRAQEHTWGSTQACGHSHARVIQEVREGVEIWACSRKARLVRWLSSVQGNGGKSSPSIYRDNERGNYNTVCLTLGRRKGTIQRRCRKAHRGPGWWWSKKLHLRFACAQKLGKEWMCLAPLNITIAFSVSGLLECELRSSREVSGVIWLLREYKP